MDPRPDGCWPWYVPLRRAITLHADRPPDYKKSKSDDIMSFMLTLFERNDFIQEVQTLLGERLLTAETAVSSLEKEASTLVAYQLCFHCNAD